MKAVDKYISLLNRKWRRVIVQSLICALSVAPLSLPPASGDEMNPDAPEAILHELNSFRQMGTVLYIAAHPDDENTELLAYLARGREYRTAYMSLTRGDGGQNVLKADMGEKLGVARTQELLAARKIDGARQFFSRAVDFGFSKNYQETLGVWDKQEVLSDIVRVIREFHPDVIITRFAPSPGGTHGHHTTSTILAQEAFKAAADPNAFPEQKLPAWQAKRIFWNTSPWQKDKVGNSEILKIDATGKDAVSGESYHDIAGESRAMHKTQGFDQFKMPGSNDEKRIEQFILLDGSPAKGDIMDGVDTSWNRVKGGAEIDREIADIISKFDAKNTAASVPPLLTLRADLSKMDSADPVIKDKKDQLDRILQRCLGLQVETTTPESDVVPGEPLTLHMSASLKNPAPAGVKIEWKSAQFPTLKKEIPAGLKLSGDKPASVDDKETLPLSTPLTQPYWLTKEGTPGMFHVDDAKMIGMPENYPAVPIEQIFQIGDQTLVIHDQPVTITKDAWGKTVHRRLDIIPPVALRFITDVAIMRPGRSRSVEVEVKAFRSNCSGTLKLDAPPDWKVSPPSSTFTLDAVGKRAQFKFELTAPLKAETTKIAATAEIHGVKYQYQRQEIDYPHIPRQLLQPPAVVKAVSLDLAIKGKNVGYIAGAGDTLVENMEQMGYTVKLLDEAKLTAADLKDLDAVVLGVRVFNVKDKIGNAMPILFDYVQNGGTVISQYNRPDKLKSDNIAPYPIHISGDRVTDEKATPVILDADNPVMNTPNKITAADFDNWVQERGLYFPGSWDSNFKPILAFKDPGEAPTQGALLIAKYGKGYYIYTGLGFFRQLPAGVPGAYRLFANMVSIGK